MLDWFVARFVGNPVTIAAVAVTLATLWMVSRSGRLGGRPIGLAWAALAWGLWAIWEGTMTPGGMGADTSGDPRADLLLLIPAVLLSTLGGLMVAFWPGRKAIHGERHS